MAYVPFSLDALVNNAAIAYGDASDTMFNRLNAVLCTNAVGAYATVKAFEPLLRKSSTTPRIINVTSEAGSHTSSRARHAILQCQRAAVPSQQSSYEHDSCLPDD